MTEKQTTYEAGTKTDKDIFKMFQNETGIAAEKIKDWQYFNDINTLLIKLIDGGTILYSTKES